MQRGEGHAVLWSSVNLAQPVLPGLGGSECLLSGVAQQEPNNIHFSTSAHL